LHQLMDKVAAVEALISCRTDPIATFRLLLEPLPLNATFVLEMLNKIFKCTVAKRMDVLVASALRCDLVGYVLTSIIDASDQSLTHVANVKSLKVNAIELIKAILALASPTQVEQLQTVLDAHPSWAGHQSQRHDLLLLA